MGGTFVREGAARMKGNASMAKVYNTKLQDVRVAFDNISRQGKLRDFSGEMADDDGLYGEMGTHVQGIVHTEDYVFLSHNRLPLQYTGMIAVISKKKGEVVYWFDTPRHEDRYPHPGGMQLIGDYLMVPVENGDHNQSYVHFYDLSTMTNKVPPQKLAYSLRRHNGTGAAGITNYASGGIEYYLMAAYDNGKLHFYKSNGKTLADPDFALSSLFETKVAEGGYSSIALLTDKNNGLYMIGFWTEGAEGADPTDYMDYYTLNIDKKSISAVVQRRHMITRYGGIAGADGVHFRFGAGLRILSDTTLKAFATQRNFVARTLSTNGFPPK